MRMPTFLGKLLGRDDVPSMEEDQLANSMHHLRPQLRDNKALHRIAREFYSLFTTEGKRGIINNEAISKAATKARESLIKDKKALWNALDENEKQDVRTLAIMDNLDLHNVAAEHLIYDVMLLMLEIRCQLAPIAKLDANSPHAFLAITRNGSILAGSSPIKGSTRRFQYVRIPSRKQSWFGPHAFEASLAADLEVGKPAIAPADNFDSTSDLRRIFEISGPAVEQQLFDIAGKVADATSLLKREGN